MKSRFCITVLIELLECWAISSTLMYNPLTNTLIFLYSFLTQHTLARIQPKLLKEEMTYPSTSLTLFNCARLILVQKHARPNVCSPCCEHNYPLAFKFDATIWSRRTFIGVICLIRSIWNIIDTPPDNIPIPIASLSRQHNASTGSVVYELYPIRVEELSMSSMIWRRRTNFRIRDPLTLTGLAYFAY